MGFIILWTQVWTILWFKNIFINLTYTFLRIFLKNKFEKKLRWIWWRRPIVFFLALCHYMPCSIAQALFKCLGRKCTSLKWWRVMGILKIKAYLKDDMYQCFLLFADIYCSEDFLTTQSAWNLIMHEKTNGTNEIFRSSQSRPVNCFWKWHSVISSTHDMKINEGRMHHLPLFSSQSLFCSEQWNLLSVRCVSVCGYLFSQPFYYIRTAAAVEQTWPRAQ